MSQPREELEAVYLKYYLQERKLNHEYVELLGQLDARRESVGQMLRKIALKRGEKNTAKHLKSQAQIAMGISKQAAWMKAVKSLGLCIQCEKPSQKPVCDECRTKPWATKKRKQRWKNRVYKLITGDPPPDEGGHDSFNIMFAVNAMAEGKTSAFERGLTAKQAAQEFLGE
jgi:hypothetical protein